jgi:hypothetical protein
MVASIQISLFLSLIVCIVIPSRYGFNSQFVVLSLLIHNIISSRIMNNYKRGSVEQGENPAEDVVIVSEHCMNPW